MKGDINYSSITKDDAKTKNNSEKNQSKHQAKKSENGAKKRTYKGAVIGLSIATGVLGLSTIGLAVACGVSMNVANGYATQIENVYKKNYYELVDSVNSADTDISKLLASDDETYQAKLLTSLAQEANDMQSNIANLPLTGENVLESVKFINQMSGYTQTLEEKLVQGGTLSESDLETLSEMHETLSEMKVYLNKMTQKMLNGYSILEASRLMSGNYDQFTIDFSQIKAEGTEYPSMIYDGPFSDSVVNAEIKGLTGNEIEKEEAYQKVDEVFKNIANLSYVGMTEGNFTTYNFSLTNSDKQNLYVQVTKIGGHILTVSGGVESVNETIDMEQAEKIALDFAKANGIENPEVVWSDTLNSQVYLNIAPVEDGVVLYPDLVKVKVDMESGNVIGYDAISYYTNHTERDLVASGIGIDLASEFVDSSFTIISQRLVLAPLDYNREVLCYEFEAMRDGATYYIYLNAETGEEENILKVLETTDGSKLM